MIRDTVRPVIDTVRPTFNALVDAINRRRMSGREAVQHYSRREDLSLDELAALARVSHEAWGRPILDIGVGGGRTVKPLLAVSSDYLGIDYVEPMVEAARRRFPRAKFRHADARNMDFLADDSIQLAVFSCNGIGMVSHKDRLKILKEVRRVLVPGGAFLFSTHNRDCPDHVAGFRFPDIELTRNPAKMLVRTARFAQQTVRRVYNRVRLNRHTHRSKHYSIINDECHDYGVMLYHITLEGQRKQLVDLGFQPDAEAFDLEGNQIASGTRHSSMTLVARK